MKDNKTIIIFGGVLVFLILVLVTLLIIPNKTTKPKAENDIVILNKKAADIYSIQISKPTEVFTMAKNSENKLSIYEWFNYLPNDFLFEQAGKYASNITSPKLIEQNPKDLEKYGLKKPTSKVKVHFKDKSIYEFQMGSITPVKTGYYFYDVKSKKVYVVSIEAANPFILEKVNYISSQVVSIGTPEDPITVMDMEIARPDLKENILIVGIPKNQENPDSTKEIFEVETYMLATPVRADTDFEKVNKYATSLTGLLAKKVVAVSPTNDDLIKYGLKQPSLVVTATLNKDKGSVVFGSYVPAENAYYAMNDKTDVVFLVSKDNIPWLIMKADDVLSRYIMLTNVSDLSGMILFSGEKSYKVDFEFDKGTFNGVKIDNKTIDLKKFKEFYKVVVGLPLDGINKEKQDIKSIVGFTYIYSDKTKNPVTIEFKKQVNLQCQVQINGEAAFYTNSTAIDNLIKNIDLIVQNKSVVG